MIFTGIPARAQVVAYTPEWPAHLNLDSKPVSRSLPHRGASHDAPENTLAAVDHAWHLETDAVEIDCRLTQDGKIAILHDPDTRRTAGHALSVASHSLADLQTLDVGSWKGARFGGERIPSLSEVIATMPAKKRLFIEVKCGPEILPALIAELHNSGKSVNQFVVISYSLQVVSGVKQALPDVTAMLVARFDRQGGQAEPATVEQLVDLAASHGLDGLDLHSRGPFEEQTAFMLASRQLKFYVWTIDEPDEARRLIELGVQGIATNRPGWLREQLSAT